MSKRLYVAYGSNLNLSQMAYRCSTAKLYGTGVLENYELQFKGAPDCAFATVAKKDGASVPVAVWEIRPQDEKSLDRYEGYPSHYFKQDVPVHLDNGKAVTAMVYVMNLKMDFGMPSVRYFQTVHQGYHDCGLDTAVLSEALGKSAEQFYSSAVRHPSYQMRMGFVQNAVDDLGESTEDCGKEELEQDETDPFFVSDGMRWRGL